MKILAIRGHNLASLAGHFEVDFTAEPFSSAGLFAICGPTGAGKSTLLDTLCLALYESTPRLSKAGAKTLPDVADTVLTQQDARNLLRRGCAEGYAEVDFQGSDGLAYRARWSVRRAYGKASGSLQNAAMSLKRLPELQAIGGTNREVKSEIAARIGLSFEQFTRAVLLAQNEFSAFLKADDNERGELLETLTGSALYTQISQRAFARAKEETLHLNRLAEKLADARPLDNEARTLVEQGAGQARQHAQALEQRQHALHALLRWHEDEVRYCRQQEDGEAVVRQRRQEQELAAPRRAKLGRIEAVQAARPLAADIERLRQEAGKVQDDLRATRQRIEQVTQIRGQSQADLQQAQRELEAAEQGLREAQPPLDQAKLLDARLETLRKAHRESSLAAEEAQRCLAEVQKNRDAATATQETVRQAQLGLDSWLEQHGKLQKLAEQWPRWDSLLKQARQGAQELARQRLALDTIEQEARTHAQALASGQDRLQAAAKALEESEQKRQAAHARHAAIDASALQQARRKAETRREHLRQASQLSERMSAERIRAGKLESQAETLSQAETQARQELQQLAGRLPALDAALAQAERALRLAELACADNIEHLRAALEPETPCPVCGATEHPYASDNPQLRLLLAGLQQQAAACRQQQQEARQHEIELGARLAATSGQLQQLRLEQAEVQAGMAKLEGEWQSHLSTMQSSPSQVDAEWLAEQLVALKSEIEELELQDQAWRKACEEKDSLQGAHEQALREHGAARDALALAQQALQQNASVRQLAESASRQEDLRLNALLEELNAAFADDGADWKARWQADPAAFHAQCQADARQWLAQQTARDESRQRLATLALELGSLTEACSRLQAEQTRTASALKLSEEQLHQAQAERATLFGGDAVAQVEARLQQAIRSTREQAEAKRQAASQAEQEHIRCNEALLHGQARLKRVGEEQQEAARRLRAWVEACPSELRALLLEGAQADQAVYPALDELLQYSQDEIAIERASLQALDALAQQAQAVLQERIERCKAHQAQRPPMELLDGLRRAALPPKPASAPAWSAQTSLLSGDLFGDDADIAEPELAAEDEADTEAIEPTDLLQHALEVLAVEREAAQARSTELQLALAQDDARRKQSGTVLQQIAQQEARQRVWAQLSELIGSADGKKFRNYAQQYTLDVLVGYANRHLQELARRYRLQRIADTLALMVIDQDMGDEARSVHSLSGGESFLVSLALALALASLSSNRVKVESLFIDEGFGSLDADTLRVAMDALDGLQALGRKVGVISHVQEMTERIATKILVQRTAGGKSTVRVG